MAKMIPIAKPVLNEKETEAVKKVLLSGWITQGPKVGQFEKNFASYVGAEYACAVSSCTTALHAALLAVGVKPGDVVITVSHSFIATANSVRNCGAEPIFIDIENDSFNMSVTGLLHCIQNDCELIDGKLYYKHVSKLRRNESPLMYVKKGKSGRVAAILPVHQMGMPCRIIEIVRIARKYKIPVIEDAACAIGSEIKVGSYYEKIGRPHGDIACFSFHPRKILTTGDGGMITTNNKAYDARFRLLRQHGMSVPDQVRHGADRVIFEEYKVSGYNFRLTDIQAAVGIEQLKKLPGLIAERRRMARFYQAGLSGNPWVKVVHGPAFARNNWQSFPVCLIGDAAKKQKVIMQKMLDAGVSTRRGIMNAHQELPYRNQNWHLPASESARDTTVLIPLFSGLTIRDQKKIISLLLRLH